MESNLKVGFEYYIRRLRIITKYLKLLSIGVIVILLIDLFLVLILISNKQSTYGFDSYERATVYNLNLFTSSIGIIFLVIHQLFLNNGNTYYEEIVDEIEWLYKRESEVSYERQPLDIRVTLKDYVKSRNLIFSNGTSGSLIYLLLFFSFMIVSAILKKG